MNVGQSRVESGQTSVAWALLRRLPTTPFTIEQAMQITERGEEVTRTFLNQYGYRAYAGFYTKGKTVAERMDEWHARVSAAPPSEPCRNCGGRECWCGR